MGRQKGEGARSKSRPSSSSLAASLLPSGTAAVGFGGYVGSSRLDSSLASEEFSDIDSEMAQHLKRLARKDPTTKLKALTCLSMLLKQKSGKEIVLIIPQWAFEYKKLLMDYNREVRRATHDTMTNLVLAVGRDLALHLKSLMGPWWFSQFDQIPEVAQGAKHSLQAAFPAPEKRLDALILCTTEIFMYLDENLKLTPQSMSDKVTALDELEEMHQQVISSSLLALATLIDILVGSQLEKPGFESITAEPKHASKARATAISFAEKLFSSHRYFLDFVKSQSPAIRSATYSMLRSCIKNIPHAFNEENMKTLASTILGSFQEKDPSCHSSMWDAMLLFSKRFPDSWRSVNVQKILLNRFWHFLRNGCFGSQQISYPSLVLFLDSLPPKEIEGEKFFLEFFQNLWVGRNPSNPSNADRVAFFQAFKECFLWGLHNASRAVLGGSVEDDQASFLSRDAMILIFEDVLKKLLTFIMTSSFIWVKDAGSLLAPTAVDSMTELESSVNMLEATQFALEILDGSFFCLQTFCEGSEVVPCLSAALFIIGWECNMARALDNAFDDQSMEITKARMNFGEALLSLRGKINKTFWQSLSIPNQKKLGSILILTIRSAIFKEDKVNANEITSLCFLWMAEVLECLCQDQYQEQNFLDLFLANSDVWPLWIMPDSGCAKRSASLKIKEISIKTNTSGSHKFVAIIEKLISALGIDRVVAGYVSNTPNSTEEASKELATSHFYSRAWLAAEILCTWKWQGGSALGSFLPLLCSYAKSGNCSLKEGLLDSIVNILLDGALVYGASGELRFFNVWSASDDEVESIEEPFLRALVSFLITLFTENIWGKDQAVILFGLLANKLFIGESVNAECLRIFPLILSVLIRPLYTIESDELHRDAVPTSFEENQICDTIKDWVQRTLSFPPLTAWETGQDMEEWLQLVLSCYPLRALGGSKALNLERDIDPVERSLLLDLFRKQRHAGKSAAASQLPMVQILLSKLMAVSVGYCWKEFNEEDWEFVLFHLRRWIESAVVMMEEVAENVNDVIINRPSSDDKEVILKELEHAVLLLDSPRINIARNALFAFSLFSGLTELQNAEDADNSNPLRRERWDLVKDRIVEGILRLFFSTGVTEAIASSYTEASSVIASTRLDHPHFWELIALSIVNSSLHARDRAVRSIELWGLSKGPISSLYAILFSSKPVPSLQFAAYFILATEPVSNSAIISKGTRYLVGNTTDTCDIDSSSEEGIQLREDISCIIERLPYEILEVDLVAQQRVYVFLAWSLLLSHLLSSPPSSPTRERLIQHIQESANSTILDCIFQHIPLELSSAYSLKKKDIEIPAELSEAATAATRAISTGSLLFYVESLWPVGPVKMASLAGALFGLMLRVLPAYVRQWFSDLRDRSASSLIEYFTKAWCSPPLIADELSQIKKASFADENFSVSVSKSANEVVATYTKDETGMDLVIRLPPSYPLRSVDVDCTRSLGISEVKQRKWLMSMTSFVRNQNGALAEAIRIWKNNFDKEFEGVEECPICYSVIHTVNHSLPRLACKTCKHKFHSACLYKWFSTSHKSTCPLCQSPF
uniref:E3 ubiquitin-protein ligase listerin n=1 Tax=Vitis vinifera TaxID=29760 RepID=F6GUH3_VITVI